MEIFSFDDYKDYIKSVLASKGHGSRLLFAEALNCQSAYITRVLNHDAHLSLEQAVDASAFFELTQDEEDFFLLLVQFAKAGTKRLKDMSRKKIKEIREKRALLSNRINIKDELDEVMQAKYYSKWYYAAIHILITIPEYRDKKSISSYLGLPMSVVNEATDFLIETGLIAASKEGFNSGKGRIFLKGDSPFITQHHENWRMRAIENINLSGKNNIHFSSVYSLSKKDFEQIKEKLLTHLQEVREIVRPSKEEELCVLTLDFFSLESQK
ncbi:TIGR02147 family protein [Peredibacter sp. HCB2-198]|uniref:TIGR02147 family protein n=1 Tax=Peredibacter sp. HCB2-198 TaxID=3383025 RepID=UPI0038B5238E